MIPWPHTMLPQDSGLLRKERASTNSPDFPMNCKTALRKLCANENLLRTNCALGPAGNVSV
jgi:hypothetical protein